MPDLPKKKVGLVACSGEELPEGTVTRLAALRVLHELRPDDTVTICLPLFLAGGAGDRAFARFFPTIAIDGCAQRCAARATAQYSGKPAAGVVVNEIVAERGLPALEGLRHLNMAGEQAVALTAERIAGLVDQLLATPWDRRAGAPAGTPQATCACGSGLAVSTLTVGGAVVTLAALPLILEQFRQAGRPADEATAADLLTAVRVYNALPAGDEPAWRAALLREYAVFCATPQEAAP
jgi:uncharacterized metal-binding protein